MRNAGRKVESYKLMFESILSSRKFGECHEFLSQGFQMFLYLCKKGSKKN